MKIKALMTAYGDGAVREIDVPDEEAKDATTDALLDLAFRYGQNDFQSRPFPSVSVGDVIQLEAGNYRVAGLGFIKLPDNADPLALKGQAAVMFGYEASNA